ncbi:MAG: hypothetical protein OXP71_13545 [Candidatus Poribacteria bacterium]|nr:hypothetical protein [Candidatus Poribacteria bacterium]
MFTPEEISRIKTITWENHSQHVFFIDSLIEKLDLYDSGGGAISKYGTVPVSIYDHVREWLVELKQKPSPTRIEQLVDILSDSPHVLPNQ